jgi:hypothetical protein
MKKAPSILLQTALAGAMAVSALAASAGTASAWDGRRVVRCDRDGDFCVVYRCDDGFCRRVSSFHRDRDDRWAAGYGWRHGYRPRFEGGYYWYGDRHVRCDRDGDRCHVVR